MGPEAITQDNGEKRNLQDEGQRTHSADAERTNFLDVTNFYSKAQGMEVLQENIEVINDLVTRNGKYRLNSGMPHWAAAIAIRSALERLADEVRNGVVLLEKK